MAYNQPYGMPYGYQQNYPYGNIAQPQQQVYQQPQQPVQKVYDYVNGVEGAKSYQIAPNQIIMLIDSERPFIYMKQANNLGQSTIKYYELVETSEDKVKGNSTPKVEYALKSDLMGLNAKVEEIIKQLGKNENTKE